MSARCNGCPNTWTGLRTAHCATCHDTFTTPANFDKHRSGSPEMGLTQGECHDPTLNGLVVNERGYWSMPGRVEDGAE